MPRSSVAPTKWPTSIGTGGRLRSEKVAEISGIRIHDTYSKTLDFLCDAGGRGVRKRLIDPVTWAETSTYYAYDAGGNVLAIYETCGDLPVGNVIDGDNGGVPDGIRTL